MTTPTTPTPASVVTPPLIPRAGLPPLVLIAIVVTILAWASAFVVIRGVGAHIGGGN